MNVDNDPRGVWALQQFAEDAFVRVVGELARHGVDVLAVKGIVLARLLYAHVEERPMVDVDLRVRQADLARVDEIARLSGWRVLRTSRQLGTLEIDLGLKGPLVELETTIGPPGVCEIDVEAMFARSVERTWQGVRYFEPDIHDHALLLCVNVFKDKLVLARPWAREDLARIAKHADFSPMIMASRAADARLCEMVLIVSRWLGAAQWERVAEILERGPRRRAYGRTYLALANRWPESRVLALVARAASDDPRMRARAIGAGFWGTLRTALRRR